jgi:hypothetical protein
MHDIIGVLLGLILGGLIGWYAAKYHDDDGDDGYSLPRGKPA